MSPAEITVFTKSDGPLTKRIWLDRTGKVVKDGSACIMVRGKASRVKISSISDLAGVIEGLTSNQAITLGRLRCDLADEVAVTTKHRLNGELTDTKRRVTVSDGETIDTVAACPPLTLVEQQTLRKMRAEAAQPLLPDRVKVREAYIADQAKALAETSGMSRDEAMKIIATKCRGTLLADVVLIFDDPELGSVTVADVLDDPARFEGATLADPIEGIEYGRCKAKVMRRSDGAAWINSFAHGRTTYELKYDARAVRARIEAARDPVAALVRLVTISELDDVEMKRLEDNVAKSADVGVRVVASAVKAAKAEHAKRMREEIRERELANRTDPRPHIANPATDAPWTAQMQIINEVISRAPGPSQTRRDVDGIVSRNRRFPIPNTHAFTSSQED